MMKKYIAPTMSISIFSDITETTNTNSVVDPTYVTGLQGSDIDAKAQVKLNEMSAITKFTF